MVKLKISVDRDPEALERVMAATLQVHHDEEPVLHLREDWASRAAYDPTNDNPNRWWNNGRGTPERLE